MKVAQKIETNFKETEMESVHVRESNSEVLVFIDRNVGDRLHALEEAAKILAREIIRERGNPSRPSW